MHELEAIARAARRAVDASETPVLATVLEVTGSSYRQPGAHMLVTGDGWQAGSISGGCLEGDIVRRGAWLTRAGQVTLAYDTSDDEAAYGLGCGGSIRVLLERLGGGRTDLLGFLEACLARRQPGVVATVIASPGNEPRPGERLLFAAGRVLQHDFHDADTPAVLERAARDALAAERSSLARLPLAGVETEVFLEHIPAPPPLVVFGAGHDAAPVVQFAKALGFHVTLVDGRPAYANATRFPLADEILLCLPDKVRDRLPLSAQTLAIVMTHHFASDRHILAALLESPARYIGLLGPRKRSRELLASLDADIRAMDHGHRLFAPVGLDLGAEGPAGVALAILAELQAVLAGRRGGHLRDRPAPIHAGAGCGLETGEEA